MGTIIQRKRGDGTTGYMAQVRIKQKGKIIHAETKTFDRKQAASAWIARRETELREPGALERIKAVDPTLGKVIDRYIAESKRDIGRTKTQVLRTIKTFDIAEMKSSTITSADIVAFAQSLKVAPQTVGNYLSHLAAIFAVARPAWGYPLDREAMKDAFVVARRLGLTAKGGRRERRPTLEELDRLMEHFGTVKARRPDAVPMQRIIPFAIFSTRRQEEIVRIRWDHYDSNRVMVRDMKHPGDKAGNDVWCDLPPEASAIIESMSRCDERIFPYSTDAISAAFTRACHVLGIEDLHFHDLRHDGVSRLFEMGRTIPQAASISGHRSWSSLQRYAHLRQLGDKYAQWKWSPTAIRPGPALIPESSG
jgi:integrase